MGVGADVTVGVGVGVGVGAPQEPSDVQGWPVPVTPLWVAGSSPRVHQFARYRMPPALAVLPET